MSIFDVDYIGVVWELLVPPDKRMPKWLAWGAAVMQGKQWWHNAIFTTYAGGSADGIYNTGTNYSAGDRVIYSIQAGGVYFGDNAVYEALCSVPSNNPPTGANVVPDVPPASVVDSTTALTWLTTGNSNYPYYWVKVINNFIGANERASYSAQKLIFEYALNRWFNTTFRQPNGYPENHTGNPGGTSDIYIVRNENTSNQFFWGQPGGIPINSFFGPVTNLTNASAALSKFFTRGNSFLAAYDFSINIPVTAYNALDNETAVTAGYTTTKRNAIVGAFVNLLNPAGSLYNIITY